MNAGVQRVSSERSESGNPFQRLIFVVGVAAIALSLVAGFVEGFAMSGGPPFGSLAYNRVAKQYMAEGRYAAAAAEYRGEQRINQLNPVSSIQLAESLQKQGDVEGALEALRIGATRSFDPALYIRYAQALARAGRDAEAEQAMHRATEIDPANPRAIIELGNFYAVAGRFEQAAVSYERALEIDPSLTEARRHLGEARKRIDAGRGRSRADDAAGDTR